MTLMLMLSSLVRVASQVYINLLLRHGCSAGESKVSILKSDEPNPTRRRVLFYFF